MRGKRWLVAGLIVLAAIILILATTRLDYDESRDIWNVESLGGISFTCLNDRTKGPVCWFYIGERLVGYWPVEKPAMPTPYPTSTPYPTGTPYPTSTPYPTYTPPGMQSA